VEKRQSKTLAPLYDHISSEIKMLMQERRDCLDSTTVRQNLGIGSQHNIPGSQKTAGYGGPCTATSTSNLLKVSPLVLAVLVGYDHGTWIDEDLILRDPQQIDLTNQDRLIDRTTGR
jgi:hypothetical protein